MIIIKTPFRISFFGGGTDIEEYYQDTDAFLISTAINQYVTLVIKSFPSRSFQYNYRIIYREVEELISIYSVSHPIIKTVVNNYYPSVFDNTCFDLFSFSDVPSNSGLSSSSAFTASCIQGLAYLANGHGFNKTELVRRTIEVERKFLEEAGGHQDQVAVVHGGFNYLHFNREGYQLEPVNKQHEYLQSFFDSLILVHTGINRNAREIEKTKFSELTTDKLRKLDTIKDQARYARGLLEGENTEAFAALLTETWNVKKSLSSSVSNDHIDELFEFCTSNGATGGKLLGAGGGGYLVFLCHSAKHKQQLMESLDGKKIGYIANIAVAENGTELLNI